MKITKMIAVGLFGICIASQNIALAGTSAETPPEFKLIGQKQSHPLFQLNLNNKNSDAFLINIKDEQNHLLYSEKVKGAEVSRTYQLAIDEDEMEAPGFGVKVEVESTSTHDKKVYTISTQTSVSQNMVIEQL